MLSILKKDINRELGRFIRTSPMGLYIKKTVPELYAGIKDFIERPGKRIRPLFFILGYLGYTRKKKIDLPSIVRSSLSAELLHAFLLIHDDIIDDSALRRGKPTLHIGFNSVYAKPPANKLGYDLSLVAGDIIFALAVKALFSAGENASRMTEAADMLAETAAYTGLGEFIDVINSSKAPMDISEKDVLLAYGLKTSKYTFEGPLLMGSILAGADKKEHTKLSRLGSLLGLAFQIQDDLLDVFSSSKATGKTSANDLEESKRTLLIAETYARSGAREKNIMDAVFAKKKKTKKDISTLINIISASRSDIYCLKRTEYFIAGAKKALSSLKMRASYKQYLSDFITSLSERSKLLGISISQVRGRQ
ncbi:MAG: polyprenyl synthetase family protein [Candidatus Omnitrophota bacterium]|nr:polyprenyl synthetase family protein [Candidatus Omnitrophota bacterium]